MADVHLNITLRDYPDGCSIYDLETAANVLGWELEHPLVDSMYSDSVCRVMRMIQKLAAKRRQDVINDNTAPRGRKRATR